MTPSPTTPPSPVSIQHLEADLIGCAPDTPAVWAESDRSRSRLRANNDREAAACFLREYADSPHTHRAYKREVLRLLLWSETVIGKAFEDLVREDIDDYFAFVSAPPADWISPGRHVIGTPAWRPFRGPLKGASLRYVKRVCDTLFAYLVEAHYVRTNPFALARKRTRTVATEGPIIPPSARRHQLPDEALQCAQAWIDRLPEDTDERCCRKRRYQALWSLFLFTGGRLSEIAHANTRNLIHTQGRWTLWVIGKGGQPAGLPLPPTLMRHLSAYRLANGLPALPAPGEGHPLLSPLLRPTATLSDNMIYREVKAILAGGAERAQAQARTDLAQMLLKASTHWLRHTSIGATVQATQDLQLAQQLARHSSVNTTMHYSTLADEQFHDKVTDTLEKLFNPAARNPVSPG